MGSTLLTTLTYLATRTDATLCPYDWYKALVIAGAREHGLPPEYLAAIEIVKAKSDDDAERRAANRALLPLTSTDSTVVDDPLKPLADVNTADSRQVHFVETLPDAHAELAGMTLTACTPKAVRQLFETAKNVSLYSFFVYPFHQVSESVAFQALEMALRAGYKATRPPLRPVVSPCRCDDSWKSRASRDGSRTEASQCCRARRQTNCDPRALSRVGNHAS